MSERKNLNSSDASGSGNTHRHKTLILSTGDHKITVESTTSNTASSFAPGKIYTKSSSWRPPNLINTVGKTVAKKNTIHKQIRDIFKSPKRSDKDAMFMIKHLAHVQFLNDFHNLNPELNAQEALIHVCRHLGYEKHHQGDVIFQEGDESNGKMYIIFTGAVNVVMKKDIEEVGGFEEAYEKVVNSPRSNAVAAFHMQQEARGDPKTPKALWKKIKPVVSIAGLKKKDGGSRRGSIDTNASVDVGDDEVYEEMAASRMQDLINLYGQLIDEIPAGGFFGEKALISKIPRTATIITSKETEFLTISSDLFQFVKSRFEKTNSRKLNFILDFFPIMETVSDRKHLNSLTYILEERRYKTYDEIIRQGKEGKDFFVVYEGECVIYKEQEINIKTKDTPKFLNKLNPRKFIPICTLQPGSFFGEEILFNQDNYNFTVKAGSANVVVFALKKKKFEMRFPKGTFYHLENLFNEKKNHYNAIASANSNTLIPKIEQKSTPSASSVHLHIDPEKEQANKIKINEIVRGVFMPSLTAYKDPDVLRSSESVPWFPKIDESLPFMKLSSPESDMFYDAGMKDLNQNKFDFGTNSGPKIDRNPSNSSRVERMIQAKYLGNAYGLNSEGKRINTSPSPLSKRDVYLGTTLSNRVKKMKLKDSKGFNPSVTVAQSTHLYFSDRLAKTAQTSRARMNLISSSGDLRRHFTSPKIEYNCSSPKFETSSPRVDLQSTNFKTEDGTARTNDLLFENDSAINNERDFSDIAESPKNLDPNDQEFFDFEQEFWRKTMKSGELGVAKKRIFNKILKITKNNNKLLEGSNKSSFYDTMSSRTSSFPEITRPNNYSIEVGFIAGLKAAKSK